MLGLLRQKRNSPIIVVLLLLIIGVFIFFFGTSMDNLGTERLYAAKVDGEVISDRELATLYSNYFNYYQTQSKGFDREQAQRLKLRETALDQLIARKVLAHDARSRGLAVNDAALRDAILKDEKYQKDGRFDPDLYDAYVRNAQMSPTAYEDTERERLLQAPIALLLERGLAVSSKEAKQSWESDERSMSLEFLKIDVSAYDAQAGDVTPADVEAWKAKEGAEEKIKKHFEKHKASRYEVPKKVRARHILIKADANAAAEEKAAARTRLEEAKKAVEGGMDFAEAATKWSEDSTKDKGGDLGFFSAGQMVPQFEEAAFALAQGGVSPIVETRFGFHLIKVEEIQEPVERKLEDVSGEIAQELAKQDRSADLAEKRAKELHEAVKAGRSFAELVEESKAKPGLDPKELKAEETGSFTKNSSGYIPKLGVEKDLAKAAWKLSLSERMGDGPFRTDAAWIIYRLKDKTEPSESDWTEAKRGAVQNAMFRKRNDIFESWGSYVRSRAKVEIHPLATSYDDEARSRAAGRR